jgi:hypothetical protein
MSRPQWENDALLAIMRDGVAIEDAPWVLECITKAVNDIAEHDDDLQFPLFMEYHETIRPRFATWTLKRSRMS